MLFTKLTTVWSIVRNIQKTYRAIKIRNCVRVYYPEFCIHPRQLWNEPQLHRHAWPTPSFASKQLQRLHCDSSRRLHKQPFNIETLANV